MSDKLIFVYMDLKGLPYFVGRLYTRNRNGRESASFEYDRTWHEYPDHFALEPALELYPGQYHTGNDRVLFGSILDSAPDRWGRTLMRRAERKKAEHERRDICTLSEIDFLLQVDDETRQGALRFTEVLGGPFLAPAKDSIRVPPLIDLPRLLSAADHIENDDESDDDLRALLAPGSSLGGARPKASVRDRDGRLLIAKFSRLDDEIDLPKWEALALHLGQASGLQVSTHRLEHIGKRSVLLIERFDRVGTQRIPFLSMMSLLGATDNQPHSYLEIAEGLRRHSILPAEDLPELWSRMVFSVLISNVDDHLRNHALLCPDGIGWRLSPAYDLNPTPTEFRPRRLSTAIVPDNHVASIDLALSVAERFTLTQVEAKTRAAEIARIVATWRTAAKKLGVLPKEIDRMASAFEHHDLQQALSGKNI